MSDDFTNTNPLHFGDTVSTPDGPGVVRQVCNFHPERKYLVELEGQGKTELYAESTLKLRKDTT